MIGATWIVGRPSSQGDLAAPERYKTYVTLGLVLGRRRARGMKSAHSCRYEVCSECRSCK
jgi:hypothetical protein